jgi:DNA-directed RNA polymerase specialized sigma24 family protein
MQLTYFAGHTHLQASALLGIPVATYKSRVLAALVTLRRLHPSREGVWT